MKSEMSLDEHMSELRRRVLFVLGVFLINVFLGVMLSVKYASLVISFLPLHAKLIALSPFSASSFAFQFGLIFASLFTLPFLIYQLVQFVKPAFPTTNFKGYLAASILLSSGALLFTHVSFRYALSFLLSINASFGLSNMLLLENISSFFFAVLFLSLFAFQMPIFTFLLNNTRLMSYKRFLSIWKYLFLASLILGAFFSPPDILSMFMVAVPLFVLSEAGAVILFLRDMFKKIGGVIHDRA